MLAVRLCAISSLFKHMKRSVGKCANKLIQVMLVKQKKLGRNTAINIKSQSSVLYVEGIIQGIVPPADIVILLDFTDYYFNCGRILALSRIFQKHICASTMLPCTLAMDA